MSRIARSVVAALALGALAVTAGVASGSDSAPAPSANPLYCC